MLVKLSHDLAHSVRGNGKRDAVRCYSLRAMRQGMPEEG